MFHDGSLVIFRQRLAARRHLSVATPCALDHDTQAYFIQRIESPRSRLQVFLKSSTGFAETPRRNVRWGHEPKSL